MTRRTSTTSEWRPTRRTTPKKKPRVFDPLKVSPDAWEFVPEAGYYNLGPGWATLEDTE